MHGVIAAGGELTAEAGRAMLQQGGNAVDAAVAAAFASFITEIGVVHWGGSGVAQIFDPALGRSIVYDFFSNMPGLGYAQLPTDLDFRRATIDFGATTQDFWIGRGSVAVSGNIFGLCQLAADYGRLPLRTLLEPALNFARDGLALPPFQAFTCQLLEPLLTKTASARSVFMRDGRMIHAGERFFLPDLYETLLALAEQGPELLRHGALAKAIVADQAARGGLLTQADLDAYEIYVGAPLSVPYRGYDVLLPPPSSIGGVLIAFTLKLLAAFDVDRLASGSSELYVLLYEAFEATTRARRQLEQTVGSGGAFQAHLAAFLADDFVAHYVAQVRQALRSGRPYAPPAHEEPGHNNTSHLSVLDADGMAVSLTTTGGESAGYVVPGTGFILNNMLGEEDLNPLGWHRWQPGQRLPTMMAPALVLKDGRVRLATGSGGSARIRSAIVQVISNVIDHDLHLSSAVNRPRVHVENGVLQCEFGFDETAVAAVAARGYPVNRWYNPSMYFGGAHSVGRNADGTLLAIGDRRRDGRTAVH